MKLDGPCWLRVLQQLPIKSSKLAMKNIKLNAMKPYKGHSIAIISREKKLSYFKVKLTIKVIIKNYMIYLSKLYVFLKALQMLLYKINLIKSISAKGKQAAVYGMKKP